LCFITESGLVNQPTPFRFILEASRVAFQRFCELTLVYLVAGVSHHFGGFISSVTTTAFDDGFAVAIPSSPALVTPPTNSYSYSS